MSADFAARIGVLSAEAAEVPPEWTSLLETAGWPPLRFAGWEELTAESVLPDLVLVFPSVTAGGTPATMVSDDLRSGVRWVLVQVAPDVRVVQDAHTAGYHEVLDRAGQPGLLWGVLARVAESRDAIDENRRLLDESLVAYEDIRWLDRIREDLRVLDYARLVPRMLQSFAQALGETGGCFWTLQRQREPAGSLVLVAAEGMPAPEPDRIELHALPQVSDLLAGRPVSGEWQGRFSAWIPILDGDLLLALIEIPRSRRANLLHREAARVRMCVDWLGVALRNSLELDQMRSVLRSRFGDYFAPDAFRQHLDKAMLQASRYRRPMTLVGLRFSGDMADRERFFQSALALLRDADICEEPAGDRVRLFLPETGYLGGVQFLRRIRREMLQKFGPGILRTMHGVVVGHPWHGNDVDGLFAELERELGQASRLAPVLEHIRTRSVLQVPPLLAEFGGSEAVDPNLWADLVFHLVQEISLDRSDDSRLVLFLGGYRDATRAFGPLFDYPARWDRILVAAGIEGEAEHPESHLIRLVRDDALAGRYLALYERPGGGSVAIWSGQPDEAWPGGICSEPLLVQAAINRFEDQTMLHHRWVVR